MQRPIHFSDEFNVSNLFPAPRDNYWKFLLAVFNGDNYKTKSIVPIGMCQKHARKVAARAILNTNQKW